MCIVLNVYGESVFKDRARNTDWKKCLIQVVALAEKNPLNNCHLE